MNSTIFAFYDRKARPISAFSNAVFRTY